MLTTRSEILLQVVLGAFLLGFVYLGVERLWIVKVNAQLATRRVSQMLNQCRVELHASKLKEASSPTEEKK